MSLSFPNSPKSEWLKEAEAIKSGAIRTSPSDIPTLILWLQDMNWPGAPEIAEHLQRFGNELMSPIAAALKSDDLVWTHWVLISFADAFGSSFWLPLKAELDRIAFKWDAEGAHIDALYILAKYKLASIERIKAQAKLMIETQKGDRDDYSKVKAILDDGGA